MTSPILNGETAPDRRVYQVTGKDALTFLQGMVSNDVLPLGKGDGIVWAALLTPQGKYLADFLLIAQGGSLLLDIKDSIAEATIRRLSMYRLRADVQFAAIDLVVRRDQRAVIGFDAAHGGGDEFDRRPGRNRCFLDGGEQRGAV